MVSLLTNTAALSALRLLAGTQASLGTVQAQVSTGLRVAQASDDAAYWSIGATMKATTAGLAAGEDSLSLEMGVLQTAQSALGLIRQNVVGIGDDLVQALQPGVDKDAIERDVAARQAAVVQEGSGASFDGVNVLVDQFDYGGYNEDQWGNTSADPGLGKNGTFAYQVPTGVTGDALDVHGFDLFAVTFGDNVLRGGSYGTLDLAPGTLDTRFDTTNSDDVQSNGLGIQGSSVLTFSVTTPRSAVNTLHTGDATDSDLQAAHAAVDQALSGLASVGAGLGGQISLVANLQDYDSKLSDALTAGVGSLVDADMSAASTRLQALQTQQQLGLQALSIANGQGGEVLQLLRTA